MKTMLFWVAIVLSGSTMNDGLEVQSTWIFHGVERYGAVLRMSEHVPPPLRTLVTAISIAPSAAYSRFTGLIEHDAVLHPGCGRQRVRPRKSLRSRP